MNRVTYFLALLLITSCAKLSYLTSQSVGQLKLQWNGRKNEEVLKDPKVKESHKKKIKLIKKYKTYFYDYFKLKEQDIYSQTTFLKSQAVTYLVTASPYHRIKPKEFSFPFVGAFPYIGFFNKEDAEEFADDLEIDNNFTHMRPVYAYSTLGYFEDRILSSFFVYNEEELAELIFHELFHTIFFIKDEVELNENLANFFSKKMKQEYFQYSEDKIKEIQAENELIDQFNLILAENFKELDKYLKNKFKNENLRNKKILEETIKDYQNKHIWPKLASFCSLDKKPYLCSSINQFWNTARMAGFLTYESENNFFEQDFTQRKLSLLKYFKYLEKSYENYKKSSTKMEFIEFLKTGE